MTYRDRCPIEDCDGRVYREDGVYRCGVCDFVYAPPSDPSKRATNYCIFGGVLLLAVIGAIAAAKWIWAVAS